MDISTWTDDVTRLFSGGVPSKWFPVPLILATRIYMSKMLTSRRNIIRHTLANCANNTIMSSLVEEASLTKSHFDGDQTAQRPLVPYLISGLWFG